MRQPKLGYRRSCTWFHTVITVSVHSTVGSTMRFKSCIPGWDRADDRGPLGDGYHHTRRRTERTAAINPRVSAHADSAVTTEPVAGSAFHRDRPRCGNILGTPLSHNHRDLGGGSSCLSERPLVDSVFCPRHPVESGPDGYCRVGRPHRAWHGGTTARGVAHTVRIRRDGRGWNLDQRSAAVVGKPIRRVVGGWNRRRPKSRSTHRHCWCRHDGNRLYGIALATAHPRYCQRHDHHLRALRRQLGEYVPAHRGGDRLFLGDGAGPKLLCPCTRTQLPRRTSHPCCGDCRGYRARTTRGIRSPLLSHPVRSHRTPLHAQPRLVQLGGAPARTRAGSEPRLVHRPPLVTQLARPRDVSSRVPPDGALVRGCRRTVAGASPLRGGARAGCNPQPPP